VSVFSRPTLLNIKHLTYHSRLTVESVDAYLGKTCIHAGNKVCLATHKTHKAVSLTSYTYTIHCTCILYFYASLTWYTGITAVLLR